MKNRRLKIKLGLFCSLVLILSVLIALYAAFCRGGEYNKAYVELPSLTTQPESTAEPSTEPSTEPIAAETEPESVSVTESTTAAPAVTPANYKPEEVLAGENWALAIINKNFPLPKTYSPTLTPVIEGSSVTADSRVSEAYAKMYAAAKEQGIILTPYAGYCGFARQQSNFDSKVQSFVLQGMTEEEANEAALKRIEPAGCNESGAGLSVDIISAGSGFATTAEYAWLTQNAQKYGFILRYPEDKTEITGIIYQPWHWRYVGVEAAEKIKASNQCLEEFLGAKV